MNNKIIKITTLLLILTAITTTTYAYSKTLTNNEYIEVMTTSISETSEKVYHKKGSQWKALFGNIDEGYIKPELNRLNLLKTGCVTLRDKANDLKIRDKNTKQINETIITKYDEVINLIDSDIAAKENILNATTENKTKLLKELDYSVDDKINNNFYDINTLLQNLEVENLK